MAKIAVTNTRGRKAPASKADRIEALAETVADGGTYLVTTPSATFDGARLGVGFAAGVGLATAEQARQLEEIYGYHIAPVAAAADETAETAARLAEVLTPADDVPAGEAEDVPPVVS